MAEVSQELDMTLMSQPTVSRLLPYVSSHQGK